MDRLAAAVAELEEACREAGIDVEAPVERPPPSVTGIGLQRAAHEWAGALEALHVPDGPGRAMLVAGKVARVGGYADDFDEELWAMDAIPNLLVLEHVLDAVRVDVDAAAPRVPASLVEQFRQRDAALRAWLAPLFAMVTASDRALLDALRAAAGPRRRSSPAARREAASMREHDEAEVAPVVTALLRDGAGAGERR